MKIYQVLILAIASYEVAGMSPLMAEFLRAELDIPAQDAGISTIQGQSPPWNGKPLNRKDWVLDCSSSAGIGHGCYNIRDGDNETFWLSQHSESGLSWVTVDLGNTYNVSAISALPRQDGSSEGFIVQHSVYLSSDLLDFGDRVAYGTWYSNKYLKLSIFEPKAARYVTLAAENSKRTSLCDLHVYHTPYAIPQKPNAGVWGPTIDLPLTPVSSANDPEGNIILWSSWARDQFHASPGGKTSTAIWDPIKQIVTNRTVSNTKHDMFCPGTAMDGYGNIVVTGGNDAAQTSYYNGTDWLPAGKMNIRRGYQSSSTLSDGRVFVIGGSWSGGSRKSKDGEVYDPDTQEWSLLKGCDAQMMLTDDSEGPWRADNHGWIFGWKNNSVIQAGPSIAMNWFDTLGDGHTIPAGKRSKNAKDAMSGSAVMYDAVHGKILACGGAPDYEYTDAHNQAYIITIDDPFGNVKVEEIKNATGSGMNYARTFHTAVVLPDGKVFIAGGQIHGIAFDENTVQFTPELFDPETKKFYPMQTNNMIRVYHTVSMLLADGRVLNGGGGLCGNCMANHYDAQIFTPPYLLDSNGKERTRPEMALISSSELVVGETMQIFTKNKINKASLVRLGSATHTVNTDQRRIPLKLKKSYRKFHYSIDLPDDSGILLPGWWMLFVIDNKGVPSIAEYVRIQLPTRKTSPPASLEGATVEDDKNQLDRAQSILEQLTAFSIGYWRSWKPGLMTQI